MLKNVPGWKVGLGLVALGCLAMAAAQALGAEASSAVTVSSSSAACLGSFGGGPAGQLPPGTSQLVVQNEATSDKVAFALGYGALPTAAIGAAGSFTLTAGSAPVVISDPNLGGSYLACIGTGADPMTILLSSKSSPY